MQPLTRQLVITVCSMIKNAVCIHFAQSSVVAEMGDRLATIDMGRKVEAAVSLFLRGGGLCLSSDVGRRLVSRDSHCRRHDAADRSIQRADDRVDVSRSDQLVDRPTDSSTWRVLCSSVIW